MRLKYILGTILGIIIIVWIIGLAVKIVSAVFHIALGALIVLVILLWWLFHRRTGTST